MKNSRILKIFSIAVILSLLMLAIPVLPALAAESIVLSPSSAKVGDRVNYTGSGYVGSGSIDYYLDIYISDQMATLSNTIDLQVTRYKKVVFGSYIDLDGTFSGYFNAPATLNEGTVGIASPLNLTAGQSYYVYATSRYSDPTTPGKIIRAIASLTVTPGAILDPLSPLTGPAGTDIMISGANFPASTTLVFTFDVVTITPKAGDTSTRSSGIFLTTITVPATAATGSRTITVTAGTTTVSATFGVTASATLDPVSPTTGAAGSDVTVSGANFPASTALVFKFDTAAITPKSGDASTRSSGVFISTITIPATTTAGAHTITVTAGTGTATATFTVTATAGLSPLSPTTGPVGTDVTITGANFLVSYPIIFKFEGTTLAPKSGDINTSTTGGFTSIITIPAGTAAGSHTISVTVGTVTQTATFTVTGSSTPTPTTPPSNAVLNIITSGDTIGSQIAITGAGFTPGADVTFKYDDMVMLTVKANTSGQVSQNFNAPVSKHGEHTITVSDGTHSGTTKFTVESQAPPVPPQLSPATGAKVKSPMKFDWQEVTDASLPVTYNFQIASDNTFAASSILLDKKALDKSDITLATADELKLKGQSDPYYWRVQSVDGAQNASAWTSADPFYVGSGGGSTSSFPKWVWPLVGSVGGLLLFLIGFWIGRRTAFYY